MNEVPERFSEYIAPNCDRRAFIQNYLRELGVESVALPVAGKNHIFVKFPQEQYNDHFKIKTVVAHYDRAAGSPGANDNSAANFCIMDWAAKLRKRSAFHNVRIFFSDGEELGEKSVAEQGSFSLAAIFKKLGLAGGDVYVFDCMGRGDIPILGKNDPPLSAPYSFRKQYAALEERAKELLKRSGVKRWIRLPFAYSDNAGFIASGIPAVAITMLPQEEADKYSSALLKRPLLERFIKSGARVAADPRFEKLASLIPETWRLIHTQGDDEQSLTPESFSIFNNILNALADARTPA